MTLAFDGAYRLRMFTLEPLGEREHVEALFDMLEAAALAPTHAGERDYSLVEIDRAATVAAIVEGRQHLLCLARREAPRYEGAMYAQESGMTSVSIDFDSVPRPPLVYELGQQLAERLCAVYGTVHPYVQDGSRFSGAGNMEVDWLRAYGPSGVAVRTWYGEHLVALFGESLLRAAGVVTSIPWGGLRLDLLAEPWSADIATLKQRQAEAIAVLASAQVLGDYSHPVRYKRGARWVPIPEGEVDVSPALLEAMRAAIVADATLDRFDIRNATLPDADLARLRAPGLRAERVLLDRARLTGAKLLEADLTRASLVDANLDGVNLSSAQLHQAILRGASLRGAMFTIASCRETTFIRADLRDSDISGTIFAHCDLTSASLAGVTAAYTQFPGCKLFEADLHGGNFANAMFGSADLRRADLRAADLRAADLRDASMEEADLRGADLRGADLRGARLRGAQLEGVQHDDTTQRDESLSSAAQGRER